MKNGYTKFEICVTQCNPHDRRDNMIDLNATRKDNVYHIALDDKQAIAAWVKSGAQTTDELVSYLTGIIVDALEE